MRSGVISDGIWNDRLEVQLCQVSMRAKESSRLPERKAAWNQRADMCWQAEGLASLRKIAWISNAAMEPSVSFVAFEKRTYPKVSESADVQDGIICLRHV